MYKNFNTLKAIIVNEHIMRQISIILTILLIVGSYMSSSKSEHLTIQANNLVIANEFIDAFYSFNQDTLASILTLAKQSQSGILYYQKWAECGNYKIIEKNDFIVKNDSLIICPITVKDDLIGALNIKFNVTDTFHLKIINGQIRVVQTSSNDPDVYYKAKEWVKNNLPELIEKPCEGIWEDGTPCECIQAMVKGFTLFMDSKNKN